MIRAAVCPEYGPPEVVRVEERPSQPLDDEQMRVRVGAAAVNYPDVLLVANQYQISVPPPFVVGSEFAGVVIAVASSSDGFAVGDRVTGRSTSAHALNPRNCIPAGLYSNFFCRNAISRRL